MTSFNRDYFNQKQVKFRNLCTNTNKMKWCFIPGGGSNHASSWFVVVFSVRTGFRLQVYESSPLKLRYETETVTSGDPTAFDSLCVSATNSKVVVGGMQSQTVWVFKMHEESIDVRSINNFLWSLVKRSSEKKYVRTSYEKASRFLSPFSLSLNDVIPA